MEDKLDFNEVAKSIKNIYNFKIENGIPVLRMDLPDFVKERIEYFRKERFNQLTFIGHLDCVLAYDEEDAKEEFMLNNEIDWLPVSEEFKEWRDTYQNIRQVEVATAIIYGTYKK